MPATCFVLWNLAKTFRRDQVDCSLSFVSKNNRETRKISVRHGHPGRARNRRFRPAGRDHRRKVHGKPNVQVSVHNFRNIYTSSRPSTLVVSRLYHSRYVRKKKHPPTDRGRVYYPHSTTWSPRAIANAYAQRVNPRRPPTYILDGVSIRYLLSGVRKFWKLNRKK